MTDLKGKVILVTGASKGIGRETALRLAKDGADMVLGATSTDLLDQLSNEINQYEVRSLAEPCDVANLADCQRLVDHALDKFGRIDVLVNNAGVAYAGRVVDLNPESAERMVQVNLLGMYYITRSVLPTMIAQGGGDIVNMGSIDGLKYSPNIAMYSATKFAVRAFTEGLRNEVQEHDIRVTLINPGKVNTDLLESFNLSGSELPVDKGEILKPETIAEAIYFAVTRPRGVALNELTIRPTWQER